MKALQGQKQGIAEKVGKGSRKLLKTHHRFLGSGTWAEDDQAGHSIVCNAHGVEATSRFSFPR